MDNPITRLAPQLFGEYPKSFLKLYEKISIPLDNDKDDIKKKLWRAYEFGHRYHEGQKRLSGEPYFNHCIEVAETLASWNMDYTTIMAGLLHDVVEDTKITINDLEREFDTDLANLVDGLTKISGIEFSTRKEKQAGNFMKMLLSVAKDIRVIIIKFADRMHNMQTIEYLPKLFESFHSQKFANKIYEDLGLSKSNIKPLKLRDKNDSIGLYDFLNYENVYMNFKLSCYNFYLDISIIIKKLFIYGQKIINAWTSYNFS